MPRVLLILALVATAFWVFTIVDCAVQPPTRHRGVRKSAWILIVVFLPVVGGLLWLTIGRTRAASMAARRAPDDDPEFLGTIGSIADQDERIRRLEEELAQLDAEDDDPRWNLTHADDAASDAAAAADPAPSDPPARGAERGDGDDDGREQRGAVS
ncbi:hypothetical protein GCM10022200_28210 [Microbacterium awajiense]|uniref:Cardiolipin synthase N-terminal domain-containing protein n=1 Tax=Microbacterium awajiense TaxID=415214 RepID=A0ABP7AYA8_9MICO